MTSSSRADLILNRIATVAVIVLASVILVQRLTAVDRGAAGATPQALPDSLWTVALAASRPIGRSADDGAALRIVEFTDFDCPACAAFHAEAFEAIQKRFGDRIQWRIAHFPLTIHPKAKTAAVLAECAAEQDRFEEAVNVLFDTRQQIDRADSKAFAHRAEVRDTVAFDACTRRDSNNRVDDGLRLAATMGFTGTPTLLVEGWRDLLHAHPTRTVFVLDSLLADGMRRRQGR
jgi:protein-disulfide isomerase